MDVTEVELTIWRCPTCNGVEYQPEFVSMVAHRCYPRTTRLYAMVKDHAAE